MEKSELNSSSLLKIRKYCCEKSYGHKVVIYVEVLEVAQIFSHISNHLRNNKEKSQKNIEKKDFIYLKENETK